MSQSRLTPRQQDVFKAVCLGKSNKQIARDLQMAEATVKLHLTSVFRTLGVHTRTQAALLATEPSAALPTQPLTGLAILEEFATVVLTTPGDTMPARVVAFGRAIEKRIKGEMT